MAKGKRRAVDQLVDRRAHNPKVAGSSPARASNPPAWLTEPIDTLANGRMFRVTTADGQRDIPVEQIWAALHAAIGAMAHVGVHASKMVLDVAYGQRAPIPQ